MAQAKKKRVTASRTRKQPAKAVAKKSAAKKTAKKTASKAAARKSAAGRRSQTSTSSVSAETLIDAGRGYRAVDQMTGLVRELAGIGSMLFAVIIFLALLTFHVDDPGWSHTGRNIEVENSIGVGGAWLADVLFNLFGYVGFALPVVLAIVGWRLVRPRKSRSLNEPFVFVRLIGVVLLLISACGLSDLHFEVAEGALPLNAFGGGILGTEVAWKLVSIFKPLGTTLLLVAMFFSSLTLMLGSSWSGLLEWVGSTVIRVTETVVGGVTSWFEGYGEFKKRRELTRARESHLRDLNTAASLTDSHDPLLDPLDGTLDESGSHSGLRAEIARARMEASGAFDDFDDNESSAPAKPSKTPKKALRAAKQKASDTAKGAAEVEPPLLTNPVLKPARGVAATVAAKLATEGKKGGAGVAAATTQSKPKKKKIEISARNGDEHQYPLFRDVPDSDLPPLSLLDPPQQHKSGYTNEELETLSRLLEVKLADFNISVEVVAVQPGPVITRFELQPEPGTKAKQITNLTQDIARSLSLVSVRVVEVIAGKSTIGLEIPNEEREIIQLSELLQSDEYDRSGSPLTLALGKNISGVPTTADLTRMPHLLVAGTTGSGKSVAVNAMLLSLLYKATAQEVRLILVDPKMLELNIYDGIPHLLTPVVTDMKEAANALRWCVGEMERRYKVMASLGVRNLAGYNKKVREAIKKGEPFPDPSWRQEHAINPGDPPPTLEPFPVIVVVVDEFADMMMQVGKKAEELIARIAQKARAAGIHLILATQRPSVDVITGLIKANIPSRIAFQVSSRIDSRTILDQMGAESLLGHGDMLYQQPGTALPERIHGAFVDDHEVHAVVAHLKAAGEPNYIEEIVQESGSLPGIPADPGDADGEQDALYDQAVAIVTESRRASISYVQRRLKIGYNRAARIVEDMESAGVVSQVQSNGNREVLAPPPVSMD